MELIFEKILTGHMDYVRSIAVHPTNPWIISSSDDRMIRIWNWDKEWKCEGVCFRCLFVLLMGIRNCKAMKAMSCRFVWILLIQMFYIPLLWIVLFEYPPPPNYFENHEFSSRFPLLIPVEGVGFNFQETQIHCGRACEGSELCWLPLVYLEKSPFNSHCDRF